MFSQKISSNFVSKLPADPVSGNERRQVDRSCFSFVYPKKCTKPKLISTSESLAELLGFTTKDLSSDYFTQVFSGNIILPHTNPYAMCYGGHQFGQWAGQLGDGRAINLFDIHAQHKKFTLQLKGAGDTPYARFADGLAVLRSSVREFLCSEAMFNLGVPTTRALTLISTGDKVKRDMMYDGNTKYEPGAIVCRVAETFIRFGNFEILTARKDVDTLKKLADFTIQEYFPEINSSGKTKYIDFFKMLSQKTLLLAIEWQRVGFVHGVLNTDNMSILGLTLDYGPFGWLEEYDPYWTPNTTDFNTKRYTFGKQPQICLWNLLQLANALYPLIEDVKILEEILQNFQLDFEQKYSSMMLQKIGIENNTAHNKKLLQDLLTLMFESKADYTIFFRKLSSLTIEDGVENIFKQFRNTFYRKEEEIPLELKHKWIEWIKKYQTQLADENLPFKIKKERMDSTNPKYILRNYMSYLAIQKAEDGDFTMIELFKHMLLKPYDEQPEYDSWFTLRPEWADHTIGSSVLSCSS